MSAPRHDPVTGLPRWDLADGRYVLADSAINGGGLRIMRADGRAMAACGADVAVEIGSEHPAVIASAESTALAREAQASAARALAQILRDGRAR